MTLLVLGLILFLGIHSTRIVADGLRTAQLARLGEKGWKGAYSIVSLLGFALIVWGFGQARQVPVVLWTSPTWARHAAALLVLLAFILLAAAYVPRNHFKASVGHPMVAGVKLWALAHLISNGRLADVVLFGSFLVWAVALFAVSRRRDRAAGTVYPPGTLKGDLISVAAGLIAFVVFAFWLHGLLFGVRPFG